MKRNLMFNEEIKKLARNSWAGLEVSLSYFLSGGNELTMTHSGGHLKFMFTNNSKPLHYKEAVKIDDENYTVADMVFEDKYKGISFKYPYIEEIKPARLVEDTVGLFGTGNYTFIKESKTLRPDYDEVERIISNVLEQFQNI
jgi:hypothetical protein